MTPLRRHEFDQCDAEASESGSVLLNRIRMIALDCRCKAQTDLFEACSLLAVERDTSLDAHIEALVRCLPEGLGKRAVFYRPGVAQRSFDEAWLMRVLDALSNQGNDSAAFLLRSRVEPQFMRHLVFLLSAIGDHIRQD